MPLRVAWVSVCLVLILLPCSLWAGGESDLDEELNRYDQAAAQCMFTSDFWGAERCWAKAVAMCEKEGGDPLDLANFLNSLGAIRLLAGKPKEAQGVLERALKIRREKLGDRRRKTISTMKNLSQVYVQLGKHRQAEDLLCICLRYVRSGATDGPKESEVLSYLGRLYLAAERYDDAERCFLSAAETGRKNEEHNSNICWHHRFLADLYLAQGDAKRAKEALASAVRLDWTCKKDLHRAYAQVNMLEGKYDRAEESLALDMKDLEPEKARYALPYARDLELLARVKVEQKKLDEAAPLFQECLKLRESVLGDDHPLVASVLEQQCRSLPEPPAGAAERARAIRKKAEAQKPLGLAKRQAAGELLFEGTKDVPKD